jgi:hypothetical protein
MLSQRSVIFDDFQLKDFIEVMVDNLKTKIRKKIHGNGEKDYHYFFTIINFSGFGLFTCPCLRPVFCKE